MAEVGADPGADDAQDDAPEKDGGFPMSLEEVEACDMLEMAKDRFKSRLLQRSLLRGSAEVSQRTFEKAEPFFMELVRDQYGNYLSQKILEVATAEQFERLFKLLKEELRELAQDMHGTRAVQKVVEQAIGRDKVSELMEAVSGDLIEKLARSVTGFHVIVKLLESLPAKEAEELLEQLCGTPEKALSLGKDQWGCCVLKKCIDRAEGAMKQRVIEAITDNTMLLVQDPFGNYTVQHLILNSNSKPNSAVTRIIDALRGRMFELCLQKFSSNVLEKCLLNSTDKDRNKIINEILNPPNHLPSEAVKMLIFHQYGNYVFQQALEVAKDPQFSLLVEHSKQHIQDVVQEQNADKPNPAGNLAAEHTKRLALKLVKRYPPLAEGLEMEIGNSMAANAAWGNGFYDPYATQFGFDPYGGAWGGSTMGGTAPVCGGYPFQAWDPSFGGYSTAFQPSRGPGRGGGKGGRGGNRARSQGRRDGKKPEGRERGGTGGKQGGGKDAGAGASQEAAGGRGAASGGGSAGGGSQTMRIGRIVGFWPDYTITYDEVKATSDAVPIQVPATGSGGGGGRGNRTKSKAKAKAVVGTGAVPGADAAPSKGTGSKATEA